MAEASPIEAAHDDRSRTRRSRRPRHAAEHVGDRCDMCRRKVVLDARGRCPLGHQVVPVRQVEQRAEDRGEAREAALEDAAARTADPDGPGRVVATYIEPRTTHPASPQPTPAATTPADGLDAATSTGRRPSPSATPIFDDPPPPLPLGTVDGTSPPTPTLAEGLPIRIRQPLVEAPTRSLFSEALGSEGGDADHSSQPIAARTALLRRDVGPGRVVVPLEDLTPEAPSALDLLDDSWAVATISVDTVYEQEPLTDGALEPPRGVAQMVAGTLFIIVLLAIAWYLATSL